MGKEAIKKSPKAKKQPKNKHLDEVTADLQRVQADFINFKRQVELDTTRQQEIARRQMVAVMLPIIDNIERATSTVPKDLKKNSWAEGVNKVSKQMFEELKKIGVEKIPAQGQDFDPELMQAVSIEDGDGQHEVVTEELQAGYKLNGQVIRHAMVKVGKE